LPFLDLGPRRIEYEVLNGNSRRYTYFRFRPDLTLEVILPRGKSVDVEKAIRERSPWLRREYARMSRTQNVLSKDAVMFEGRLLRVVFSPGVGDHLVPDLAKGEVVAHTSDKARLRELVRRWFLRESSAYVVKKVSELAPRVGAKPSRVDVREIGKWGYCTRGGRLSFSWQIAALPERLREFVVLHELTHLVEFNHSPAFRRRLGAVCPDFRAREKELDLVAPYDRLAPP
jgi:predicted metal-dependent hydrolase